MKLEQEDIDAIVTALKAEGLVVPAGEAPATEAAPDKKVTKATKPAKPPKAEEPKPVDRNAVLELARQVRAKSGAEKAKSIIGEYGESFKDVSDDDIPALEAKLKAELGEDL